ncbi:MAG: hypothetical protein HY913_10505 [Desulfomonile tiedjei]|nr:hypothetical protein [Desulfomonile tiedjei]
MNRLKIIVAMLAALALAISIPNASFAQSDQTGQAPASQSYAPGQQGQAVDPGQTGQTGRPIPQPKGGIATVIGVDQPDNCLRIRSGPGSDYDLVGCAALGEQLNITGVWTSNNWAQLAENGWVYGSQIQTDLRPPSAAYSRAERYTYVEDEYPVVSYTESYLPDYGYETYWYGGVPLFLYSANVWRKFHPWWLRKHWNWNRSHKAWNQNPAFRQNVRAGTQGAVTPRNFVTNRANVPSSNVTRFNANALRSGSSSVVGSARTFSNLNTARTRTFSSPNTVRTRTFSNPSSFQARTFSSPNTVRTRTFSNPSSFQARTFSRPNISTRSFSSPSIGTRSFSSPARMGSFGASSFSAGRIGGGGGGISMGGGGASFGGGGRRR